MTVLQFIAVFSCLLFAGAAVYINLVEHPARLECGTELAATVFGPSYRRAFVMQAALATVSALAASGVWLLDGDAWWLVGALGIFFVVPFTIFVILPVNNQLLDSDLDKSAASTRQLLERWGRLHLVRTVASVIAAGLMLCLAMTS